MKILVVLGMMSLPVGVRAQTCPTALHPYFEFQVAEPARFIHADSDGPHPVVDPQAASQAKTDTFLVQFNVDTTGHALLPTLKVLHGGDSASRTAVRAALPGWRFQPAEVSKGCRVVQLVQTAIED